MKFLFVLFVVMVIGIGIAADLSRYRECRKNGFNVFYCIDR